MEQRANWKDFKAILDKYGIKKLYHFTDRDNLPSIINNGGLYSWHDCEDRNIHICKPGGDSLSRSLDSRDGLSYYVRVSFTRNHPMMYVAMNARRISNPIILEIDPSVIYYTSSRFSDRNATKNGANIGGSLTDFEQIHFRSVMANSHFDLHPEEQEFYQAEILIKNFIPLESITNISNFGIPIPTAPKQLVSKEAYTAQISRDNPSAFIFLVDHSCSMKKLTTINGEKISMAEAVARIVNNQINELILRCIKSDEVRHYYDIAVIGYGHEVYSGWNGVLFGRDFVSPAELKEHPYKVITTREEKRTRNGIVVKEVEKVQWIEANTTGNWTHVHKAFAKAKELLADWMTKHHNKDCYPPTIINITDGEFNGAADSEVIQLANELKSMHTNDGNVLLWNIHVSADEENNILLPTRLDEVSGNEYSAKLYHISSLLPLRYNDAINTLRNSPSNIRHTAMSINTDMSTLIQLMDIGTPTNISQNR